MNYILIAAGGALGAMSRYGLSKLINDLAPVGLVPWGTIFVNTVGAFVLAFIMALSAYRMNLQPQIIFFFGTGFLGAFTTFSTFSYEFLTLFEESHVRGFTYFVLTIVLGFSAAYFGFILGRGK